MRISCFQSFVQNLLFYANKDYVILSAVMMPINCKRSIYTGDFFLIIRPISRKLFSMYLWSLELDKVKCKLANRKHISYLLFKSDNYFWHNYPSPFNNNIFIDEICITFTLICKMEQGQMWLCQSKEHNIVLCILTLFFCHYLVDICSWNDHDFDHDL